MKTNIFVKIVTTLVLLCIISSCANQLDKTQAYQTPQQSHQLTDISHLSDQEKAELYQNIIAADLAAADGNHSLATNYYLAAARLSGSPNLIQLCIISAKIAKDDLALLQASEIWLETDPNNVSALTLKVIGNLSHQNLLPALETTYRLFELKRSSTDRYRLLQTIVNSHSPGVVNAYYEQLTNHYPKSTAILTGKAAFFARVAKHTQNPRAMLNKAFAELDSAMAIKENYIPAIELYTRLFYQSRQDEKAEALLRQLNASYPKSKDISQLLGQLLYDLKKYDLTSQHYTNWLKSNPKDHEARFFLAATHFAKNEFEKSLKQYLKVLGSDYKPQMVYFFCGNSAAQIKQYEQSIACYELIESGRYLTRGKIELAKIYALTNQVEKALETVRNPRFASDSQTQVQLINIEIELLNQHVSNEKAKIRLETAMKDFPDNVSLLFKKITLYQLADKPKPLVNLLSQAVQKVTEPDKKHQFHLSVAGFLRNNNHFQAAVDWLDKALLESPEDTDYLYARALYKEPLGLYEEMIKDFKYLLSLDPENVNIKNALGYTLVDMNQEMAYASQLIEQAYLALPNNASIIDSKGWLAFRQGYFEQAIIYLKKAYNIAPSADVATHIGEVYWTSGDKEKARKFWNQAKKLDANNFLLLTTTKRFGVELDETSENNSQPEPNN